MSDLDRYDANTALLWGLICVVIFALGWLIVAAVRYCNRPRGMATRVTRSRWEDSRQPDSRDVMAQHWRIVGRK